MFVLVVFGFFFQAEDGIRDHCVTGVQTVLFRSLSVSLLIVVASLFTGFIDTFERAAVEAVGDVILIPPTTFKK